MKDDDFFDFGGHALLATSVIGNLQHGPGIELNFYDFFKFPSKLVNVAAIKKSDMQQKLIHQTRSSSFNFNTRFFMKSLYCF